MSRTNPRNRNLHKSSSEHFPGTPNFASGFKTGNQMRLQKPKYWKITSDNTYAIEWTLKDVQIVNFKNNVFTFDLLDNVTCIEMKQALRQLTTQAGLYDIKFCDFIKKGRITATPLDERFGDTGFIVEAEIKDIHDYSLSKLNGYFCDVILGCNSACEWQSDTGERYLFPQFKILSLSATQTFGGCREVF